MKYGTGSAIPQGYRYDLRSNKRKILGSRSQENSIEAKDYRQDRSRDRRYYSHGEEIATLTKRVRELEIQNNELQTKVNLLERENMKLRAKGEDAVQLRSDNKRMKGIIKEARSSAFEILRLFGSYDNTEEVLHN